MTITRPLPGLLLVSLLALTGTAQAASLSLLPAAGTVVQNSLFTVALQLSAADIDDDPDDYFGGQIVISFDNTKLGYGGFELAPGLSYFSNPTVTTNGSTQTVTFGFDNAPPVGSVGNFSFTAIGQPETIAMIGLADGDSFAGGSFYAYTPGYTPFVPTFNPTQVTISAVPLPAGVWLLSTAIGALVARRRFRSL
jgi:hypothetical protein